MKGQDEAYWEDLTRLTQAATRRALARKGLKRGELRVLAEEAAQEVLLQLLEGHGAHGRPGRRSWQRAVWRCTAQAFRGRRPATLPLVGEPATAAPTPPEAVAADEAGRLLLQRLGRKERDLLHHLAEWVGEKPKGIHRSALAHELGVSRRTLGRRLDLLGRLLRQTGDDAALRR